MTRGEQAEERRSVSIAYCTTATAYCVAATCHATTMKSLVWFWIIDKTQVLTFMLSVCRLDEIGIWQVLEQEMMMVTMVMTTR